MNTYVKIGGIKYPAKILEIPVDRNWENRACVKIELEMSSQEASNLFINDVHWSIVEDKETLTIVEENGIPVDKIVFEEFETDASIYSVAGKILDNRDGTISVKMGTPTAEELLAILEEVL